MNEVQIDAFTPQGGGQVAQSLTQRALSASGRFEVGLLRPYLKINNSGQTLGVFANVGGKERRITANATLRKDEWKHYDDALLMAAKLRLKGIKDLQTRNLTYNIANGFAKTVLEYEDATELLEAEVNMDAVTRAKGDRLEYNIKYLPLPIIHKAFSLNARVLAASRSVGDPLDTTQVTEATFKVAEMCERILFNGYNTYTFGGGTLYGYTDFPQRITGNLTGNWDALVPTSLGLSVGQQILADVLAMIQAAINAHKYGPFVLYIPTAYQTVLAQDFKVNGDKSIRQRLLEIEGLQDIVTADVLTANNVVLVQMTPDTIRLVTGMPITNVEWKSEGEMVHHFKVMTIMVPQPRADANGHCGIVHYS